MKLFGALVFAFLVISTSTAIAADMKPNIIYIMADELAYYEPGFMGGKKLHTPNMDRLAKSGMIFKNILSGGTNCAPSRCTLLTGKHNGHSSIRGNSSDNAIRPEEQTIGELLKPLGYAVAGNCQPSRACLMSGQYTPRHGLFAVGSTHRGPANEMRLVPIPNVNGLANDNVTLAEALKAAGYVTGIFGKWHLEEKPGVEPEQQGFDTVFQSYRGW